MSASCARLYADDSDSAGDGYGKRRKGETRPSRFNWNVGHICIWKVFVCRSGLPVASLYDVAYSMDTLKTPRKLFIIWLSGRGRELIEVEVRLQWYASDKFYGVQWAQCGCGSWARNYALTHTHTNTQIVSGHCLLAYTQAARCGDGKDQHLRWIQFNFIIASHCVVDQRHKRRICAPASY